MPWNAAGSLKGAPGTTGPAGTTTLRGATDYDDSAAPTDGQAILWVPSAGKWAPRTITPASVNAVSLTATETVGGRKSFNVAPIVPVGDLLSNPVRRDDARLTDARAPTAHAGSHATGAADPITPAAIGAEATVSKSIASAKVANGYVGADANGNVAPGQLYPATESAYGVMRGRDAVFHASPTGARNDRLVHGDEMSPLPRWAAVGTAGGALTTLYYFAVQAGADDVATRVRLGARAASAGTGALNVAVFIGSDPANLARVATASATAVAAGLVDLALSAQASWTAGQWVVVAVQMTGFTTIPTFTASNTIAAMLNSSSVLLAVARGSVSAMPTTLNLTTGGASSGAGPWWALT